MRAALGVVLGLLTLNVGIIVSTATGTGNAWPLGQSLLISCALAGVTCAGSWLLARLVARWCSGSRAPFQRTTVWLRILLVAALAILGEGLIVVLMPRDMPLLGESGYYVILLLSGATLALWAHASGATPVWVATAIAVLLAVAQALWFMRDPGAQFQYGPEISLFALWGYVGRVNMLPLDVAVAWGGWRIFRGGTTSACT
jgi:hypothetical protein